MSLLSTIGAVLVVGLLAYLIYALLNAEDF
ncbi:MULTISPECIES: K(+)-transporting ATPase subunit F [unclassified Providencia]|nr:K(+)-transporting ATPase subunit F [Providencia sp.]MBP6083083.1 K(+)-transporting ATPase subunit F [Providencia sp.]HBO24665.1 K(+)-transporting ATPase subunit F [Providencia sp.]